MKMKKLVCTLLVCVMAMVAVAQEREENRLGWNIALQGGAHYSAFENTRHASFGDAVNGHVGLSVGYDFSHVIGARAELSYGRNISGTNTVESGRPLVLYHCNDVSLFADAIFNLSHLLSKDRRNNFMVEAKGYVGLGLAMPSDGTDPKMGFYPTENTSTVAAVRVGAIGEWHLDPTWSFLVDGCVTGYGDKFNGKDAGRPLDVRLGLSFGVKYHF
jgi:opacity protein-like surface antigen